MRPVLLTCPAVSSAPVCVCNVTSFSTGIDYSNCCYRSVTECNAAAREGLNAPGTILFLTIFFNDKSFLDSRLFQEEGARGLTWIP